MKNGHVLVTGGAGYIGSHACKILLENGYVPVTFDNLSTGWRDAVKYGPFVKGDLRNKSEIDAVIEQYSIDYIMHFAALSQVGESVVKPNLYWENNFIGSVNLIKSAIEHNCLKFVFSSTCATYGNVRHEILDEDTPQNPSNPYGASKLAVEHYLANLSAASELQYVIFRYFNVAGADVMAEIGEFHQPETHLIPILLETIDGKREFVEVFGTNYNTRDGTCIRDYVHVSDLVDAHLRGLEWLNGGNPSCAFNLGTGQGFSVFEVIQTVEKVTGGLITIKEADRRLGDAPMLVSGSDFAIKKLGCSFNRSNLEQMIGDAFRWYSKGYYRR